MLGSNYWNGDTSFRCSPETSCYSSSSTNISSKLCLVPRRGWAQRMRCFLHFARILLAPSIYKNTALHSSGRSHAHGMASQLLCSFIAQQCSVLASFSLTVLFIADAAPQAASEVMILLPRDNGACSLCIIKGGDITFPDSRRLCHLCINDA
jgi:hypothetical protein